MRLLLLGAPGSGKGTQATRLADHFGIAHVSSGDLLRDQADAGTPAGRVAATYLDRGDLVPDSVVLDVLREPLTEAARDGGYILDGFPRTVEQAEAADRAGQTPDLAVFLLVPREELVTRLLGRGRRTGRSDDTREVIEHRLHLFADNTEPLLDFYRRRGRLVEVDGDGRPEHIAAALVRAVDGARERLAF